MTILIEFVMPTFAIAMANMASGGRHLTTLVAALLIGRAVGAVVARRLQ